MITVDGKKLPWQREMNVAKLLERVENPEQYAVVRMNGKLVSRPAFGDTAVPDGAEVVLIPMIAGG